MVNKRTTIGFMLLCTSIFFIAGYSFAKKNEGIYTSVTTGRRMVVDHNIQEAQKNAETDALEIALQNAFSTLVPNQVLAANLEFFYDRILSRTKDYIITYKVLGNIENKGHYLVGVESKVDLNLLEKTLIDARILNANKDRPVILFFIVEQKPFDLNPKYWWGDNIEPYHSLAEKMLADQMTKEGFMIIGNSVLRPDPSFYNIVFQSISDTAAAIDLGRQMKADMIVFGNVVSKEAINRMGEERTFNAIIHLDGYNLETGEKVVNSQIEAVVKSETNKEGNTNAIAKAAALSARDLIDKIDAYWAENLRKEHSFEVKIEGDNFHPRYLALTRRFKQMPGIENMQPKEMGSSYGIIDMFYKGKASQFANALMLKTFDDFGFEFLEVSDHLVSIRLIEKGQNTLQGDNQKSRLQE
ncbi:MAG: hypothetical protein ABIJ59_13840 [Pseudomonadota bacterium]